MTELLINRAGLQRLLRPFLLLQCLFFAFMVAGTNGAFVRMPDPPTTTDFASFYAAGMLANRGTPGLAYAEGPHRRAEFEAVAPGVEEKRFLNPPIFLLICAPLAHLPYRLAFVLFEAASFVVWLALGTRVAGGGRLATMALACVPSVWWVLGWGQNSFLSASLMAAGTLLLRRAPVLAGAAFGALCFKPHFGVLIPVALLAGRHWRAIGGAVASASLLGGLSVACFGVEAWRGFISMALHARQAIETGIELSGHVDVGGAARLLGVAAGPSWAIQACISLAVACCVAWLWARVPAGRACAPAQVELAYAALVAGTVAAMPFVLFYDLVMASLAAAWLVRSMRRDGFLPGEAALMAVLMVLDLLAYAGAGLLHLAVGVAVAPALLWLAMRRGLAATTSVPAQELSADQLTIA